jgi:hypothetical protein
MLFLGSIAVALVLQWRGSGFIGYASKRVPMVVWHDVDIHWPVIPVGTVAVIGLLCWLVPHRRAAHHEDTSDAHNAAS